jgi:hypothetical protein
MKLAALESLQRQYLRNLRHRARGSAPDGIGRAVPHPMASGVQFRA